MVITIVGLGPGDAKHLTREAWDLIQSCKELYLRTRRHPVVPELPSHLMLHDFDAIYEREHDFSAVYDAISLEVVALGRRPQGVVYAVPGHPLVAESSVLRILASADAEGIAIRIVDGLSFIEPTLSLLRVDAVDGLQVTDATEIAGQGHPSLNLIDPRWLANSTVAQWPGTSS